LGLVIFIFLTVACSGSCSSNVVKTVKLEGAITASSAELIAEAVEASEAEGAKALIILLNTPGGQFDATVKIIEAMESSRVPVVSFVYPQGAKAWSAGTFILLSSHIAAMAPHTIIGSCQPVSYSPLGGSQPIEDPKIVNAVSKFLVEKAGMHGRNETAARLFVEENLNLNAEEALKFKIVELLPNDLNELLRLMDGMKVKTAAGVVELETEDALVSQHFASVRVQLLTAISDPILASVLFLIGLYAVIFGLVSPGHGAEVIGATALIIGLIGLGLNVNLGSALLILLGAVLMIVEAYTPGFGVIGGTGLVCILIGSLLLIPFESARWMISYEWYAYFITIIIAITAILGVFTSFMVYKILRVRVKKPVIGEFIGEKVEAVDEITPDKIGFVRYKGEYWRARSTSTVKRGDAAVIIGKDGAILIVKPLEASDKL
jgi:membrane-bound serine protease (ClpP class)